MYPLLGTICDTDLDIFDNNMPFKKIRRSVKNFAYTDVEKKVRKATNNDPYGPSSLLMAEIAEASKDATHFDRIMQLIWQRLDEDRKQWRHIFKALYLLEYLLKAGNEKVKTACSKNSLKISKLRHFKFIDNDGIDRGLMIHRTVESIFYILRDEEALERERQKAAKTRERCFGESSRMGIGSSSKMGIGSSSKMGISSSSLKRSVSSSTLPSTSTSSPSKLDQRYEEWKKRKNARKEKKAIAKFGQENALKLAIDLSKMEMEEIEHVDEQEDEMVQVAIEQSKKLEVIPEFEELPERPFSPAPNFRSTSQQPSSSKINAIDEIANEIMTLNFYQPDSPIPISPQFNDSFKLTSAPSFLTPTSKNLPDVTPSSVPFARSQSIQPSLPPSMLSPQSQILPDFSPFDFDPFAAASAKSLQTSVSPGYLPEPSASDAAAGDSLNPFKAFSTNNVDDKWDFAFVSPPTTNDPWSSTPTPNYDIFKHDTVVASSARGCTSNEAYQKMANDFQKFNLASTKNNNESPPELSSSTTKNPLNDGLICINGQKYHPSNPFVKDLLL